MVSHQVCTKKITQKYRVKKSKELKCYTRNNLIPTKKKKKWQRNTIGTRSHGRNSNKDMRCHTYSYQ